MHLIRLVVYLVILLPNAAMATAGIQVRLQVVPTTHCAATLLQIAVPIRFGSRILTAFVTEPLTAVQATAGTLLRPMQTPTTHAAAMPRHNAAMVKLGTLTPTASVTTTRNVVQAKPGTRLRLLIQVPTTLCVVTQ